MFTSERNECKSVHIQYDPNFKLKKNDNEKHRRED